MKELTLALLIAAQTVTPPAFCAPNGGLVKSITKHNGEMVLALGMSFAGSIVRILADANGNWSIIETNTSNLDCVVAAGTGWVVINSQHPH